MASIRMPTKQTRIVGSGASTADELHPSETLTGRVSGATESSGVGLSVVWFSLFVGIATTTAIGVAIWMLCDGVASMSGASIVGAITFVLVFVTLVVTRLACTAGGS